MQHINLALRVLLIATALAWAAVELRHVGRSRPEAETADRGSLPVVRVTAAAGVGAAIGVAHLVSATTIHPAGAARWAGLVVLWCGIGLRLWSIRTLGRYFTLTVQTSGDQPVIVSGPYRAIRHPSYTGLLVAAVGLGLVMANWLSLIVLVTLMAAGLIYRITIEERALLRDLGSDYREFAASRKRLIPFLW